MVVSINRKSLLINCALLLAASGLTAHADEDATMHTQVYEAMSPEMREAIRDLKAEQKNEADRQTQERSATSDGSQVIFVGDHPVAVAAMNEDGEIIVTEF